LHTVIITDSYTTSLFEEYRYLFAPFLNGRGGSVSHCRWNTGEGDVKDAIPSLYDEIKGHPEWRAIILFRPEQKDLVNPDNPFDFECYHKNTSESDEAGLLLRDNHADLVRLTYMLSGFPSLGVKGYQTAYVYYNEKKGMYEECMHNNKPILQSDINKIREDIYKRYKDNCEKNGKPFQSFHEIYEIIDEKANEEFQKRLSKYPKDKRKTKMEETPYLPAEKEKHKKLTEKYTFTENRPAEVLILSIREQHDYDEREETKTEVSRAWQFNDEVDSSNFWKVYPNNIRFLCYDLINQKHTLYARELQRLFLLTLTLSINQIPGRSLQAYLLYRVNLQINAEELGLVYNKYLENLILFQDIVLERMSRVPELTQDKKKELVPDQYISVNFDQIEESEVKAKAGNFGLAKDYPADEAVLWRNHIEGTRRAIDNILYAPREIVAEKALETRQKTADFAGVEQVLDRFQVDRIQRRINELEYKIFNTNLYSMLDTDLYKKEVEKAGDTVRKFIRTRPTKRNILLISAVSLLVFFCGFLPYLINSAMIGAAEFGAAFGFVIIALAVLAGGALLVLMFLRGELINKIFSYNQEVTDIFARVKKGARVFSGYFSDICTYMYARSFMSGVILKKENDNTAALKQRAHLNYLKKEIEKNISICSLYGAELDFSPGRGSLINVDEDLLAEWPSNCRFYELPLCYDKDTVELTTSPIIQQTMNDETDKSYNEWEQYNTGITLDAPYSFITRLNIVREEIYDKKEEK